MILSGRWILVGTLAASAVATLVSTTLRDPVYQATSAILVDIKSLQTPSATLMPRQETFIKNEIEVLRSQGLARTVSERLLVQLNPDAVAAGGLDMASRPDETPPGRRDKLLDESVKRITSTTEFTNDRESDVIKITAKSSDPREAALIANLYAETCRDRSVLKSREKPRTLKEFLEVQLQEKRRSLNQVEASLQRYMKKKGVASLDDEALSLIRRLAQFEASRDAAEITIQSLNKTLVSSRAQMQDMEKSVPLVIGQAIDPFIRQLQENLAELEVQRDMAIAQNLSRVDTEVYRKQFGALNNRIAVVRQKLEARTGEYFLRLSPSGSGFAGPESSEPAAYLRTIKQKVLETHIEMQAQVARKKALDAAIADDEKEFEQIPGKSIEFARLQRARLSTEKLFTTLNDKYNEATIAEQSEFGNIEIIDNATIPRWPVSPDLPLNMTVALGTGLFVGLFLVLFREYRDVRIHAPEDLKQRGLTLASVVLDMSDELRSTKIAPKMSRFGRPIDRRLLAELAPLSPTAEAYRKLRINVLYDELEYSPKAILVTSPKPGEGKSVTAANLAIALARTGKVTLLIDANLRRPVQHVLFDVHQEPGVTDLVLGTVPRDRGVQLTSIKDLHVLSAGTQNPASVELLNMPTMLELVEEAKREYDIVVFDTPPVLDVADAMVLATMADTILLVAAAGSTRLEEIERSLDTLNAVTKKTVKCVLNRFNPRLAYGFSYRRAGYDAYTGT